MIWINSIDSSTSRVSLNIVQIQSIAASKEVSIEMALTMASKRGELTTSAAGISRSQEDMHSKRCGFDAADTKSPSEAIHHIQLPEVDLTRGLRVLCQ